MLDPTTLLTDAAGGRVDLVEFLKNPDNEVVVSSTDRHKRTFLEIAIEKRLKLPSIHAIVAIKPDLVEVECEGRLPFFKVLERTVMEEDDVAVALTLLENYPYAARVWDEGMLGLHKVLERTTSFTPPMIKLLQSLIRHYSHASSEPLGNQMPLHMALHRSMPPRGIELLLASNSEAAGIPHPSGHIPLVVAIEKGLDINIIRALIEAYPVGLCQRIPGVDMMPLEYAVRVSAGDAVVEALLKGGTGQNRKCCAYAAATLDGMGTREFSHPALKTQSEVQAEFLAHSRMEIGGNDMEIHIVPYHGEGFTVVLPSTALVDDLKCLLSFMEGTPAESQKLIDSSGVRLLDGDMLHKAVRSLPEDESLRSRTIEEANSWRSKADDALVLASPRSANKRQALSDLSGSTAAAPSGVATVRSSLVNLLQDSKVREVSHTGRSSTPAVLHPYWTSEMDSCTIPTVFMAPWTELLPNAIRGAASTGTIVHIIRVRPNLVFEQDCNGRLPVHVALDAKGKVDEDVVIALLEVYPLSARVRSGPEPFQPYPMEKAIDRECSDSVMCLLLPQIRQSPSDWSPSGFYCPNMEPESEKRGSQLLFEAIKKSQSTRVIRELCESGYPCTILGETDSDGKSEYIQVHDRETKLTLLEMSISENSEDATFSYLFDTVLTTNGNEILFEGSGGGTLLHVACLTESPAYIIARICDVAEKAPADRENILRCRDKSGRTPLHCACATRLPRDSVQEMLIRDPAITTDLDSRGCSPLQIAVQSKPLPGVVFELARANTELLAAKSKDGHSLLMLAVMSDASKHVVYELLEVAPQLISTAHVFDPDFPSNESSAEVRRLAMSPPAATPAFKASTRVSFEDFVLSDKAEQGSKKGKKSEPKMKPDVKTSSFFGWLWN